MFGFPRVLPQPPRFSSASPDATGRGDVRVQGLANAVLSPYLDGGWELPETGYHLMTRTSCTCELARPLSFPVPALVTRSGSTLGTRPA